MSKRKALDGESPAEGDDDMEVVPSASNASTAAANEPPMKRSSSEDSSHHSSEFQQPAEDSSDDDDDDDGAGATGEGEQQSFHEQLEGLQSQRTALLQALREVREEKRKIFFHFSPPVFSPFVLAPRLGSRRKEGETGGGGR